MKKIGFTGGSLISQLDNKAEMQFFFDCIENYAVRGDVEKWALITDRLYRKYLKLNEVYIALSLMEEASKVFESIKISKVSLTRNLPKNTTLNLGDVTLSAALARYFKAFKNVSEDAIMFYDKFDKYQSVKVIIADMVESTKWNKLSNEEYEAVVGEPLWSRHGG